MPGRCPICTSQLVVTHVQCQTCGAELTGSFAPARLTGLSGDQAQFVELLVKNRGNVSKVAEDLAIAYSSARSRLDEIIKALSLESQEDQVLSPARRREILDQVAGGDLTADDAARLLSRG